MSLSNLRVLLADDDEDDRLFFCDAIREIDSSVDITSVSDGQRLMDFLSVSSVSLPDILFLDMNMPCENGKECLKEIREAAHLKNLVVIIYSTSGDENQVADAFAIGANGYIKKPNDFSSLKQVVAEMLLINWKSSVKSQPKIIRLN
ncbi:response regulator [Flavobacterium silvaticum]|uniref:Response regulator n=1 Tax=Flavobacterium silvaticum TaxID=1852020 RepID=A0A972FLB4_9FLAO|nr:response regulator [Flavobacterium silvaticum]NMH27340.1 response regulator [Flavobacterium silvaticum]